MKVLVEGIAKALMRILESYRIILQRAVVQLWAGSRIGEDNAFHTTPYEYYTVKE